MPSSSPSSGSSGKNKLIALIAVLLTLGAVYAVVAQYREHAAGTSSTTSTASSPEEALNKATDWASKEPGNPDAMRAFGMALLQNQRQADALSAMKRAVELDPDHAASHAGLGDALDANGETNQAALEYLKALNIDHDNAQALLGAGKVSQRNSLGYTRPAFLRATQVAPDNADAWIGLGQEDVKSTEIALRPEAVAAFDKAVALKTTRDDFYGDYEQALVNDDQFDRAEALIRGYLKSHDADPATHFLLGHLLQMYNPTPERLTEAESEIQRTLNIAPANESAQRELGNIQLQLGRATDAVTSLEVATREAPWDLAAFRILSKAYGRAGKFDRAAKAAARASTLTALNSKIFDLTARKKDGFTDPAYHRQLAAAYAATGQVDKATDESAMARNIAKNPKGIADFYKSYQSMIDGAFPKTSVK